MRNRVRGLVVALVALAAVVALAACGGPAKPSDLFKEENAWTEPVPGDATMISPEEFERMVRSGALVPRSSADVAAQGAARDDAFRADVAYLKGLAQPSGAVQDLLAAIGDAESFPEDVPVALGEDGQVELQGLGVMAAVAADADRRANSVDNALALYQLSYDLVPPEVAAQLPTPASLEGKPLADVQAALALLNDLLGAVPGLDATWLEPQARAPGNAELASQSAGSGVDTDACTPSGFVARLWFPLKSFISPIRNQARRGTCWAFTAVGAVESRELVQNGSAVNLSEQFLVNKVKRDWAAADYSDGYDANAALDQLVNHGQKLPPESAWTYNQSWNRASGESGSAANYVGACNPYGNAPSGGWCSETAHQSPVYCTTVLLWDYCGYYTVTYSGAGVDAGRSTVVWSSGQPFDLNNYRNLLAQGHVLMASFPVYEGFMAAPAGVVADYAKQRKDDKGNLVAGSYGGHAVQIVAFFSNADLSTPSYTYDIGGGGYFVVKNSWGCAGDGGYWYVPADYVRQHFNNLSVLNFDSRRSSAWTSEQANPGSQEAPKVTIKQSHPTVDLRAVTDLTAYFGVTHSVAGSVAVTVTSSVDGTIFNGAWNTAPYTFPLPLDYTFTTVGSRTITVRATYAGKVGVGTFVANVINSAPNVALSGAGTAYQGEPYQMTATVSDPNQADGAALCASTVWSVTTPDTVMPDTGCQVQVTFGASGNRVVSATTTDQDGASTTRSLTVDVQPPRANPYPVVTAYGVNERRYYLSGTGLYLCGSFAVPSGADITSEAGCSMFGPTPQKYYAFVEVDNPTAETLTYDWSLTVYDMYANVYRSYTNDGSVDSSWDLGFGYGNIAYGPMTCVVRVQINAPEAARSKSLTVWNGTCSAYWSYLG